MSDRDKPENLARTTQPDGEAEPGDEHVARRGSIRENTEDISEESEDRFDAG
ncbi:hypothetical protein [Glutamicibacter mysorens]|uniref:hypothetical protein n=1 Tax=Glutamicibacter mysorens TaxID=257984 RepID=UPI0020C5EAD2|nr:hypothetical protein [Glutamicibacter mysorens]UTM45952.1 hypothetical protein XH9_10255 [Glutamicibacter mysorens]